MPYFRRIFVFALILFVICGLQAEQQPSESSINRQLDKLRSLSPAQRSAATMQLAADIRVLPPGKEKVELADALSNADAGDPSQETLQAVAATLSQALSEHPLPEKKDRPPMPYMDLARYVRYEHVTVDLNDPRLTQAEKIFADNDASLAKGAFTLLRIEKADFTLKDMRGKKMTLSQLRGKVVVVNFWATWCLPCRAEMPLLDTAYTHFKSQGLVVLSITQEDKLTVLKFLDARGYDPPVLLDDGKVFKEFYVTSIPRTFVFDRNGKLVAESLGGCSPSLLAAMLSKTGLHK